MGKSSNVLSPWKFTRKTNFFSTCDSSLGPCEQEDYQPKPVFQLKESIRPHKGPRSLSGMVELFAIWTSSWVLNSSIRATINQDN